MKRLSRSKPNWPIESIWPVWPIGSKRVARLLAAALLSAILVWAARQQVPAPELRAWKAINTRNLLAHIKILASDRFEGRAPATAGEKLTLDYLVSQFKQLGLKPGNPDGTSLQKVPMVGITADPNVQLVFNGAGAVEGAPDASRALTLKYGDDFVAATERLQPVVHVNAPVIFCGYGVVAPEYHWDDFKGVDVRGKVIVVLVNDPPVPDPHDPSKLDPKMFGGKAMTYYGRWTYKFEEAARKGAAGVIIVHQTVPAGYPWGVIQSSFTGQLFTLVRADNGQSRCPIEAWITDGAAGRLFAKAGRDFNALARQAVSPNFKPVPLGLNAAITLHNTIRRLNSYNVAGKLAGRDPKLRNQVVIYTAHWDHLGIGPAVNGDRIYNGALDNASGVSGLIEIARAFTVVKPAPRRSILFLAVTAEEKGLLGSEYYAEHPLDPLKDTAAEINMDGLNVFGRTRDITVIGLGYSTLDNYVREIAAEQNRVVRPDQEPEKGYYFRSDHFSFALHGVPALDPDHGYDYIGRPAGWGKKMWDHYTAVNYHKPLDEVKPYWNLSGAVDDLDLLFSVGYRVANASQYPTWAPGSEFARTRAKQLQAK
jgi:Zn-dependent M28 family amino/carboxypeptidase